MAENSVTVLKVGQKLWCVPYHRYGQPCEVTVVTIGRVWATIEGYRQGTRIDKRTLHMDGGQYSSPGRCYLSREEWDIAKEEDNLWHAFYQNVRDKSNKPRGLTADHIREAAKLL